MKKIFKYIGSLLLATMLIYNSEAQTSVFVPSGLRLGTDLGLLGASALNENKNLYEINTDFDIYKFFLTADYGRGNWEFENTGYRYDNRGNYYRIGIDYNLIFDDPDRNIMFVGLRYAMSSYNERLIQYLGIIPKTLKIIRCDRVGQRQLLA